MPLYHLIFVEFTFNLFHVRLLQCRGMCPQCHSYIVTLNGTVLHYMLIHVCVCFIQVMIVIKSFKITRQHKGIDSFGLPTILTQHITDSTHILQGLFHSGPHHISHPSIQPYLFCHHARHIGEFLLSFFNQSRYIFLDMSSV